MSRSIAAPVVACLLASILFTAGAVVVVTLVLTPDEDSDTCGDPPARAGEVSPGAGRGQLTRPQRANAEAVIGEGRRRRLPDRAILIALAVANQESRFLNFANDGRGGDLQFTQEGIEQSRALPHDAVGTDHGSVGVFQQQWPWWGTLRQLMTPATAAGKFYQALLRVPGWSRLPLTVAAQRVQRSAYPSAYADDEPLARSLLRGAGPGAPTSDPGVSSSAAFYGTIADRCLTRSTSHSTGAGVFPLPSGSGYVDQRNWGLGGSRWSHAHTGTDLSVACGTPVLAATGGTIRARTDQSWAGRWLVQVSTGQRRLTTWYAHMRALQVADGERVNPGQQIGQVGDLGNATGCHLHFEVHPRGGDIYEDNVNPSVWLRQHTRTSSLTVTPVSTTGRPAASAGLPRFVLATFNTLGSSHTASGGTKPWMASGPRRTRGLVSLLGRHHVDVAGLQEFQRPQHATFRRLAGSQYAVYSPSQGDTDNSIVWRRDRWQLVSARPFPVPYFDGHPRPMSLVRLRSKMTGAIATFLNVHNPADTRRYPKQHRWRAAALQLEVALVHHLSELGGPVFVTGDMNDHRPAYCAFARVSMSSPFDGPHAAGCPSPAEGGIDWIFGSASSRLAPAVVDHSRLVRRTTDHPLVMTVVQPDRPER